MQSIGSVLEDALRELKYDTKIKEHLALEVWDKVVGENIARQTQPEYVKNNKLFVKVSTTAWMNGLMSMKQMIIGRLNRKLGKRVIEDLHFDLGEIALPEVSKDTACDRKTMDMEVDEDYLKSIKKYLFSIKDNQIRESFLRVMVQDAKLRKFREG